MKEINPVRNVVIIININIGKDICGINSFIARAAPVLVLEIRYSEINENPITNVFVAPNNTKNPFLSSLFNERVFPIIAACPDPSPGRKLHIGEAITAPIIGLRIFVEGLFIFCFDIFTLFFMLVMIIDEPNSPVSRGKRGCFKFSKFKTLMPKIPVRMKTSVAGNFLFSNKIRENEIIIRKKGISFWKFS